MERINRISKSVELALTKLENSYDDADWRHKAQALQKRRWHVIRHPFAERAEDLVGAPSRIR